MARLTAPAFSAEARGKIGAVIYNTYRGVPTAKIMKSPSQPQTALQLAIRALCTTYVRLWATESDANRALWETYAADHPETDSMGHTKRLTGCNWYVRLNVLIIRNGGSAVHTPPSGTPAASPSAFAAGDGSGQSIVTWTTPGGTNLQMELWMDGPHSAGRRGKLVKARFNNRLTAETATKTVSGLGAGTYTFFGRFVDESKGLASTFVSDIATVS